MTYENIHEGVFRSRNNRFVAEVEVEGNLAVCHVKNTGRCRELLIPGARVYLVESNDVRRATRYDLVAVWKGDRLINMDSQAPNKVFGEYLRSGKYIADIHLLKPEARYGNSRFDFYVEAGERKIFIEVKGVTLEQDGVALFPDAPTERGVKHLQELARCVGDGYEAQVAFVVQMTGVRYVTPNTQTHPAFGAALAAAKRAGVTVTAWDCLVTPDSLRVREQVPVRQ